MKKIKILIATMDYPLPMGGIQTFTYDLESGLKKKGHEVKMLNFDGRNISLLKKLKFRDLFPTPATSHPYFSIMKIAGSKRPIMRLRNFFYNNLVYRESKLAIENFKPDVIHITKPDMYSSIYGSNIPTIVSCHSEELIDIYPVRYALEKATLIHCVSNFAKERVLQIVPSRADDINVIYNAIDLGYWEKYRKTEKNNWIITICRLVKNKNVSSVIKAYNLLPLEFRNNYKYLIIGDGPERQSLENLVKELDIQDRVSFLGYVTNEEKADFLSRSKLFVMCPTPYNNENEGFGITYIESQAVGVPVIGSNVGGVIDAVGDGGLLVNNELDPQEISKNIQSLLSDQNLYESLVANAKKRIFQFNAEDQVKAIERLYERIV
jgi:glycosyltransferase involved in cell wall biosynthesis